MDMVSLDPQLFSLPMPTTIVGSTLGGRPNFMALAWLTRVNFNPALYGICMNHKNASHAAIAEHGEFSVNLPSAAMLAKADYVGLVSGARTDKSGLFEVYNGKLAHAPFIRECPLVFSCKVTQAVDLDTNTFFIGTVEELLCRPDCLDDGKPDYTKLDPVLLTMPDNRYHSLGPVAGRAWHEGKALKAKK